MTIIKRIAYDEHPRILCDPDGYPAQLGQIVHDDNMGRWVITGAVAPHKPSSTGRVAVKNAYGVRREFFPSIFDLHWFEEEDVNQEAVSEQKTFVVKFVIQIDVQADSKEQAVEWAREIGYSDGLREYCDHDPLSVHELDENGDPIL